MPRLTHAWIPRDTGRYFWFHASLLLWNATYGHAYPAVRYWWRIEPDVLFAGSWSYLLAIASRDTADLLLPQYTRWADHPNYPHWEWNAPILAGVPRSEWVYSLVSIGRYSMRFMRVMASKWAAGVAGYEEILLPLSCTPRSNCTRSSFSRLHAAGWRKSRVNEAFRYRPEWSCDSFLRAAASHSGELWHPVKTRACWARYLDSCTAAGCSQVVK